MAAQGRRGRTIARALALLLLAGCSAPFSPAPGEFSVHVKSVRIDPRTDSPVVLLEEAKGEHRRLPIWIGVYEAQSIAIGLEGVPMPRPNTHDLIKNMVTELDWKLERVVITELRNGTYYAVIVVEVDGQTVEVDSRPSDAIAVAIRTGTPVFATEAVLSENGDEPDEGNALEIALPPDLSPDAEDVQSH